MLSGSRTDQLLHDTCLPIFSIRQAYYVCSKTHCSHIEFPSSFLCCKKGAHSLPPATLQTPSSCQTLLIFAVFQAYIPSRRPPFKPPFLVRYCLYVPYNKLTFLHPSLQTLYTPLSRPSMLTFPYKIIPTLFSQIIFPQHLQQTSGLLYNFTHLLPVVSSFWRHIVVLSTRTFVYDSFFDYLDIKSVAHLTDTFVCDYLFFFDTRSITCLKVL